MTPEEIAEFRATNLAYWKSRSPEVHGAYLAYYALDDEYDALLARRKEAWSRIDALLRDRYSTASNRRAIA